MSQAPAVDLLSLDALLLRLKRLCEDPYIPTDERRLAALQTAEASTSLVVQAWTRTSPQEEVLWVRLWDKSEHAVPFSYRDDMGQR